MATEEAVLQQQGAGGNRAGLILGLALAAVAAVLILVALNRGGNEERVVPATRAAVVAKEGIPARTRLTREMLEVKTFNLEDVNADAYTTIGQLVNRVTASNIAAGEVIVPAAVSTTVGEGLTFRVSAGMRAVSIGVNEVVTAGGNLSPGNQIDIIGVFTTGRGGDVGGIISQLSGEPFVPLVVPAGATVTFTMLQNVKVIAIAQNQAAQEARPTNGNTAETGGPLAAPQINPRASTVTLELTPQQAEAMVLADMQTEIRLTVRPFGEDSRAQVTPIVTLID